MQTYERNIIRVSAVVLFVVVLIQAWVVNDLREDREALAEAIFEQQLTLDYYQSTFKERVGFVQNGDGISVLIRALSIDGGETWIEISRNREVLQPPYLHQRYPDLNPDSLQELVRWEDVVKSAVVRNE